MTSFGYNTLGFGGYPNRSSGDDADTGYYGNRGMFFGGRDGVNNDLAFNVIQYISIDTTGNATDFGDLSTTRHRFGALSGGGRAVTGGGSTPSASYTETMSNIMEYVTIDTTGNTTDFGDLSLARNRTAAASNTTRGLFIGGFKYWAADDTMDYITIDTTGNASDFGNLLAATNGEIGAASSGTRIVMATGGGSDEIQYITIDTTGNSTDFGNLVAANRKQGANGTADRTLFGGGYVSGAVTATIDYVAPATTGNASDFGDLTVTRESLDSSTNGTRSIFAGGWNGSAGASGRDDTIDYVAIATTGNATDFGNLLAGNMEKPAACSG